MFIHDAGDDNAEHKCAGKSHHEGGSYHGAAMFLILPALPGRHLYVALFTVYVGLGLEDSRNGLYERFWRWRVRRCGCRTSGDVIVLVSVRMELDIVVLWDGSILIVGSAIIISQSLTTCQTVTYRRSGTRRRVLVHWMVAKDVIVGWRCVLWGGRMSHLQLVSCDKCVC